MKVRMFACTVAIQGVAGELLARFKVGRQFRRHKNNRYCQTFTGGRNLRVDCYLDESPQNVFGLLPFNGRLLAWRLTAALVTRVMQ